MLRKNFRCFCASPWNLQTGSTEGGPLCFRQTHSVRVIRDTVKHIEAQAAEAERAAKLSAPVVIGKRLNWEAGVGPTAADLLLPGNRYGAGSELSDAAEAGAPAESTTSLQWVQYLNGTLRRCCPCRSRFRFALELSLCLCFYLHMRASTRNAVAWCSAVVLLKLRCGDLLLPQMWTLGSVAKRQWMPMQASYKRSWGYTLVQSRHGSAWTPTWSMLACGRADHV